MKEEPVDVEDLSSWIPCRMVGRFAPVQGFFLADGAFVRFKSAASLRQLSTDLAVPTSSIMACTTEGCALSVAVLGMAGKGLSFEYHSPALCCQAALLLAQAGEGSEEPLATDTPSQREEEADCAVLDEVILSSRLGPLVGEELRLLAWERCMCTSGTEATKAMQRPGVLYVCEKALFFVPDRYCKSNSISSLKRNSVIISIKDILNVLEVFGGIVVECRREKSSTAARVMFQFSLDKDWEALAHASYVLVDEENKSKEQLNSLNKITTEAEAKWVEEWLLLCKKKDGSELKSNPFVKLAVSGGGYSSGENHNRFYGVPKVCRTILWRKVTGAEDLRKRFESEGRTAKMYLDYQHDDLTLQKAESEINKDIHRTFSDHDLKECMIAAGRDHESQGTQWFCPKLKRVLIAYARYNPQIGYCQSLNYIAGIVVTLFDDEEDCFWVFLAILHNVMPKSYYADLSGVLQDVKVLNLLLESNLKSVKDKLELVHLPLSSFAAQWFMCAYVNVLPPTSVIRIWDFIFVEGAVALFRVALALLKAVEGELSMAVEMEDALMALQRSKSLEIETILQIAQACFGEQVVDLSLLMQLRHRVLLSNSKH
uniref:Rab-GAP TBC domain-containing protein n=1 Tax=Guillardia theta TaxID=55529 RepID=A0A7S4UEU6_GUITH|mmetsp:Transcript_9914/g.33111  ORF Transcript_9914/g.33111 Transcript_9914/m.33111 type:complete len:599 (+) Transcript_9914:217-2013(+)